MNIGVQLPNPPEPPAVNVDPAVMAKDVEDAGFESYWVSDHPVAPVECASYSPVFPGGQVPGFMDPIVAMALAAKTTSHIKIGTCVLLMPERNTLLLAKQIATLDRYGGGRFIFGIGTGWNKEETAIMGGDTDRPWAQSLEACLVMKELWTKERAEFHGEFHDFPLLRCAPKPLQQPPCGVLGGADRATDRFVGQEPGNRGEDFQMLVGGILGDEQAEEQIDGLAVGGVEVHPLLKTQERRESSAQARHARMRQGAPFSEPGRTETLALDEPVEDGLRRQLRGGTGENRTELFQRAFPARGRHMAAHALGREDRGESYLHVPARARLVRRADPFATR